MSDHSTNAAEPQVSSEVRAKNFRFTIRAGAVLLVVGGALILWPSFAHMHDAMSFMETAASYLEGGRSTASAPVTASTNALTEDRLRHILDAYTTSRSSTGINRVFGLALACAGVTILLSRLVHIDLRTSGLLKVGPVELPVQASGAIALFFGLLAASLGVVYLFGLHDESDRLDELAVELTRLQRSATLEENQGLRHEVEVLEQAVTAFAGNRRVDVEFVVECQASRNAVRVFTWDDDRNEHERWRLGVLRNSHDEARASGDPTEIQVIPNPETGETPKELWFRYGGVTAMKIIPEIHVARGVLEVRISPVADAGLSLQQYCLDQTISVTEAARTSGEEAGLKADE
jgi:hypothetical protein